MLRQTVIAAVALIATAPCSATLVEWGLFGEPGNQASTAPSFEAANLTGLVMTRGAGLSAGAATNSISSSGWTGQATDYFSFGFTVADGYVVDLDNLLIGTRSSNTGPGSVGLYYSGNSFASPLVTITQSGTNFTNTDADLSALTGLTGEVEFRILQIGTVSANGGSTSSTGTFRIAEYLIDGDFFPVQFSGTISAIPEPTAALFGSLLAGAFGLMVARRPTDRG